MTSTVVKPYITQNETGFWVGETRISLDSVIYAFLAGDSPESIAQNFSLLSLEQVYGAIAFYLGNRRIVDEYLEESEAEFQQLRRQCREQNSLLYKTLEAARTNRTANGCETLSFKPTQILSKRSSQEPFVGSQA